MTTNVTNRHASGRPMLLRLLFIPMLIAGVAMATPAYADFLALADGDRLEGKLVEIDAGVLVFDTRLAGRHIVPVDRVSYVSTEKEWRIKLADGTETNGKLVDKDNRQAILHTDGTVEPIPLAKVQQALPEETKPEVESAFKGGSFGMTGGYQWGADEYAAIRARLLLRMNLKSVDFESDSELTFADEDATLPYGRSELILRWMPEATTRPYVRARWERDLEAALDREFAVGTGLERTLFESERQRLDAELGLDLRYSAYEADRDRARRHAFTEGDRPLLRSTADLLSDPARQTDVELDLTGGLDHKARLWRDIQLEDDLQLSLGLSDWGDVRARYRSRVLFPLTDQFKLKLEAGVDFDDSPAYRYLNQWRSSVGAGFQMDF